MNVSKTLTDPMIAATAFTATSALNNMAVAMMSRQELASAERALKDALSILRVALAEEEEEPSKTCPSAERRALMVRDYAHQKSRRAMVDFSDTMSRTASCKKMKLHHHRVVNESRAEETKRAPRLYHLCTIESNDLHSLKDHCCDETCVLEEEDGCHVPSFSAVYIREDHGLNLLKNDPTSASDQEESSCPQRVLLHILSGIILYNYGVAAHLHSLCQEQEAKISDHYLKHRRSAQTALELANQAFSAYIGKYKKSNGVCWKSPQEHERQAALLSVLCLSSTSLVLQAQHEFVRAFQTEQNKQCLLHMLLLECSGLFLNVNGPSSVVATAA